MIDENYLNHPTFGLLFSVCRLEKDRTIFTTLYAQRLFFIVGMEEGRINFDSISRQDAKGLVETQIRNLRRAGLHLETQQLQAIYQKTFQ